MILNRRTLIRRTLTGTASLAVLICGSPLKFLVARENETDPIEDLVKAEIAKVYEIEPAIIKDEHDLEWLAKEALRINDQPNTFAECFLDSQLMPIEVIIELEDKLKIDIPDEVAEKIETVGDLIDVVREKLHDHRMLDEKSIEVQVKQIIKEVFETLPTDPVPIDPMLFEDNRRRIIDLTKIAFNSDDAEDFGWRTPAETFSFAIRGELDRQFDISIEIQDRRIFSGRTNIQDFIDMTVELLS